MNECEGGWHNFRDGFAHVMDDTVLFEHGGKGSSAKRKKARE